MELYNSLIQDTEKLLANGSPKVWDYSERDCWIDIGSSELVMQRDAAYELGASGRGSANYVLFSSSPDFVSKDQVVLYGRDLRDIKGDVDFIFGCATTLFYKCNQSAHQDSKHTEVDIERCMETDIYTLFPPKKEWTC